MRTKRLGAGKQAIRELQQRAREYHTPDPCSAYQFGNEPRVDPELRADGAKNFDFSFQKSTAIYESASLQFRAEFFNVFNRVQFAPPIPTVGGANYGNVTYQVNKPRQIQLSMRVNF